MAEAIHDEHSPLARFLRQSDSDEDNSPDANRTRERDPSRPVPAQAAAAPPPPAKRSRREIAAVERVKYAIATSALLSAKLGDALQIYPPLETLQSRQPAAPSRGASTRPRRPTSSAKGKARAADWGTGWDTRGQGVRERGVLGSAQAALTGLVGALGRFSSRDEGPLADVKEETGGDKEEGPGDALRSPQDALLSTVEGFIAASQELDLRIAAALTAIKELECIAHGLGLSDPLPPISRIEARGYLASPKPPSPTSATMMSTPSRSPRIPSPLGGPSKAFPPDASGNEGARPASPPPLRASVLRTALADALASALAALSASTAALNAILPSDSPLLTLTTPGSLTPSSSHAPQASLSELMRHDSLARAERSEISRWEEASAPSPSRPTSMHLSDGVDPFHPTESTFGGIDRRGGAEGTPQRGGHRLRASLGPPGSPAEGPVERSARRKRPVSMGGLSALDTTLREAVVEERNQDVQRVLLVALQDRFDDAHDARRGVLWRLLEALDHAASDESWTAADGALVALCAALADAARVVATAHTREFPDAGPSPTAGHADAAAVKAREKRRRSGFYARSEADALPRSGETPPTPSPVARLPPPQYANFAPSPSPRAPPPRRVHAHSHAPSVAVDAALAGHVQRATLALRAAQAKMRVVLADAGLAVMQGEAAERERVLGVWESMQEEIARLEGEWRAGEKELRRVLGMVEPALPAAEPKEAEVEAPSGGRVGTHDLLDAKEEEELNATGAVYATLDASAAADGDDLVSTRQAVLDAALSLSLLPPDADAASPAEEKVFEAIAGPDRRAVSGEKLSRDERIRRMKEAREALALGRISLESPSKALGEGGGADTQRNMVGELREVLKELNRDKGRAEVGPAQVPLPPPPPQPQFVPPQSRLGTPPPAVKPLSPPPQPQVAPLPPPSRSSQPAFVAPPPQTATPPTSQRAAPPPARRPSQPHFVPPPTPPRPPPSYPLTTPPPAPATAARYASPPPAPGAVPSTPGKQPTPRYVSPPPSTRRARAPSQPFPPLAPPVPSTPGKQQVPRYVAPPAPPLAQAQAQEWYSPTGPISPVRGTPPRAAPLPPPSRVQAPGEGAPERASAEPQRVKRPSVQTV